MVDVQPHVLRRMFALRTFRVLGDAQLGELAMLAENVTEATFRAGTVIAPAGARLPGIHFILDGEIASQHLRFGARNVFGVLDVLAKRALAAPAVAVGETRTLELGAADIKEVLDENFGVLRATLRELALRMIGRRQPPPAPFTAPIPRPLGFVDRLIVLRRQPAFASASFDALAMLAHASEEVAFRAGTIVAQSGAPATAAYAIISGELRAADDAGNIRMLGPGDSIGPFEVLAEASHAATIEARTPVRALEQTATAIFDVIEDHTDLGVAMVRDFARALTETST